MVTRPSGVLLQISFQFEMTDEARYALMYGGHYSDEAEMISQFVEDLYKYEYLILIKKERIYERIPRKKVGTISHGHDQTGRATYHGNT